VTLKFRLGQLERAHGFEQTRRLRGQLIGGGGKFFGGGGISLGDLIDLGHRTTDLRDSDRLFARCGGNFLD